MGIFLPNGYGTEIRKNGRSKKEDMPYEEYIMHIQQVEKGIILECY
jgi:hypothetical protein